MAAESLFALIFFEPLLQLDEWTIQSLEATANRTVKVGRFTVSVQKQGKVEFTASMNPPPGGVKREESFGVNRAHARKSLGLLPWQRQVTACPLF